MESLLFTGASGFLGNNILQALRAKYQVDTLGHLPVDDITVNLAADTPGLSKHYDVVLHAAGKAHMVPSTPRECQSFYDINYQGTIRLCRALDKVGVPKSLIFISTVAVYGCDDGELIDESHPLEGTSPYARSKILAEQYLTRWCDERGVILTILRPSLLAGTNPPGNLGDMIRSIRRGFYFNIANGAVKKSIMMASDIPVLMELARGKGGVYNVCDSQHPSFGDLSEVIARQLGRRRPLSIPYWIAKTLALAGDRLGRKAPINSSRLEKLTRSLTFSNSKAVSHLGWQPLSVVENFKIS